MINYRVYKGLCLFLNKLCKAYYEEGLSLIPDEEYDRKFKLIVEFENANPELIHKKSPTQRVGGLKENMETVTHLIPMQSLKNALTMDELKSFVDSIREEFGPVTYIIEPKYDGLASDLTYMPDNASDLASYLVQAATRGDGIEGEDITRNVMLTDIPKVVMGGDVNVRGELMLTKSGFKEINNSLGPKDKPFANPRNAIAGLLRRKQLDARLAKFIHFFPYELVGEPYDDLKRSAKLKQMAKWYGDIRFFTSSDNFEEITKTIKDIHDMVETFAFEVDGLVFKIEDAGICKELGNRSTTPRWAIAYKFPPVKSQTIILDFVWQVGRTGENAPVAKVAPTQIGGVVVDSALAHNLELIKVHDWRIGDTVEIFRSGEVIPKLGEVDKSRRLPDSQPLEIPTTCSCCGSPLEKVGPTLYCLNKAGCDDQLLFEYDYIFSRNVLDVESFSEKTIEQIVKKKMVKCAADFFDLTVEDFLKLDGYAEPSAKKLYESFQKARIQSLEKVIQALCIPDVGASTSRNIARHLGAKGGGIVDFFKLEKKELLTIDDVGPGTVAKILWCFSDPLWMEHAMKLASKLQIQVIVVASIVYRANITDKRFVITGVFPESRDHMKKTLELFGAAVGESVSGKTDYLIVGGNPSSKKVNAANKHSVPMLDYNQYQALFSD